MLLSSSYTPMTPVAIRESPQSRYPHYAGLLAPLRPTKNSCRSRASSPGTCLPRSRNRGTRGQLAPSAYSSLPFVTAADYQTTTCFRYPISFQLFRLDRGVGPITVVVSHGEFAAFLLLFYFPRLTTGRVSSSPFSIFSFLFSLFSVSPCLCGKSVFVFFPSCVPVCVHLRSIVVPTHFLFSIFDFYRRSRAQLMIQSACTFSRGDRP
jgi:hypothetical protein